MENPRTETNVTYTKGVDFNYFAIMLPMTEAQQLETSKYAQ